MAKTLTLGNLGEDAARLDVEAFAARHGAGFLLQTTARRLKPPDASYTEVLLEDDPDPNGATADLSILVHSLCGTGDAHLVTMGRGGNNDIVVRDPSVSRFHAFAKHGDDGGFLLQDAGSTNGTTVDGVSVAARGAGAPTLLTPGATVRMGQVEFTYTDAAGLRTFAAGAAR
ncbi:MAG: FHA domain-containing protein [Proteobacteria bacterium]|nr:FHA domain-containing protein [Pseudomonadota bacterium]